jgi:hypothetical protein
MLMMSLEIHKVEIGIRADISRRKRVEKDKKGLVSQTILKRGGRLRRAENLSFQVFGSPSDGAAWGLGMAVILGREAPKSQATFHPSLNQGKGKPRRKALGFIHFWTKRIAPVAGILHAIHQRVV